MTLEAIRFTSETRQSRATLQVLDQLQLPHTTSWSNVVSSQDAFEAIRSMRVRGAPAIALVAALALVVEDSWASSSSEAVSGATAARDWYCSRLDYLVTSRPTAVNLGDAANKLKLVVRSTARSDNSTAITVREAYATAATQMLEDDVRDNKAIGSAGAQWLVNQGTLGLREKTCTVVTHCNTGSATSLYFVTFILIILVLHVLYCFIIHAQ
jgi:methylthioribose-1-phosphate isomerase